MICIVYVIWWKESNHDYPLAYSENQARHITAYHLRNIGFSLAVRSMHYDSGKPQVVATTHSVKAGSNAEVNKTWNHDGPETLYELTFLFTRRYLLWVTAYACSLNPVCKRNPAVCKVRRGVLGPVTCHLLCKMRETCFATEKTQYFLACINISKNIYMHAPL